VTATTAAPQPGSAIAPRQRLARWVGISTLRRKGWRRRRAAVAVAVPRQEGGEKSATRREEGKRPCLFLFLFFFFWAMGSGEAKKAVERDRCVHFAKSR
jgi:hypothetical protein